MNQIALREKAGKSYLLSSLKRLVMTQPLWWILSVSLVIRLFYLFLNYPLWWDSHIYISIGKYIFSHGKIGIWESFRPLIHPLILGSFWKLRLDPVIIGKILDLSYSLIVVYLVYNIADRIFSRTIAISSSILFSLTPLFVMYTGLILTEPLALLWGLLGIVLIIKVLWPQPATAKTKRATETTKPTITKSTTIKPTPTKTFFYLGAAGILLGLSFLTRFPQGIWFGTIFLILLFREEPWGRKLSALFSLSLGFFLPVAPFLLFNYFRYGNAFQPFLDGSWIVTTATWLYGTGWSYYFSAFFLSNPVYLLSLVYLYFFFRERHWKNQAQLLVVLIPFFSLLYFLYVPRKETRYLVTSLPFLAMLAAFAALGVYHQLKMVSRSTTARKPIVKPRAFLILCLILFLVPIPIGLYFNHPPTFEQELRQVIKEYHINGTILASDPSFVSFLDDHIITLDGMEFAPAIYQRQRGKYQLLFMNECSLICAQHDQKCREEKKQLMVAIQAENREIFKKEEQGCTYLMYLPK